MYTTPPNLQPPPKASLHTQKIISLIIAGVVLVGMILPWATMSMGGLGLRNSGNGFQGWGILSLFGLVAVIVASLSGNKLFDFDKQMRMLAIAGFSAITLGAFIAFMQLNGNSQLNMTVKSGIGIWFTLIAGILGLLSITGVVKLNNLGKSFQLPTAPPPPAPPHNPNNPNPPYPPPPPQTPHSSYPPPPNHY